MRTRGGSPADGRVLRSEPAYVQGIDHTTVDRLDVVPPPVESGEVGVGWHDGSDVLGPVEPPRHILFGPTRGPGLLTARRATTGP